MDKLSIKLFLYITAIYISSFFLFVAGIIPSFGLTDLVMQSFFQVEGFLIIACILLFIYRNQKILENDPATFLQLGKFILIIFFFLGILPRIWNGIFRYFNISLSWAVERHGVIVILVDFAHSNFAFFGIVTTSLSFYFILPFIMAMSHKYLKLKILNKIGDPLTLTNQFLRKQILLVSVIYLILWVVEDMNHPVYFLIGSVPGIRTIFYLIQYLIFLCVTYYINKYLLKKASQSFYA